jgi:hypothetical protein
MFFMRGHGQVRLGGKEMIEAPLVNAGPLANFVNAYRAIAAVPHQIKADLQQFFFCFTGLFHIFTQQAISAYVAMLPSVN